MARKKAVKKRTPRKKAAPKAPVRPNVTNMSEDDMKAYVNNEAIWNAHMSRQNLLRTLMDPRRDIDDECGYPKTEELTDSMYKIMYERESIATKVVDILPMECWKQHPQLTEDEDPTVETDFEIAWDELGRRLDGDSWFSQEQGNPVWEYLRRADILSGIGHFGVILLGLDDGEELQMPVEGIDDAGNKQGNQERNLTSIRCFDEYLVNISQWEDNPTNPRFGFPRMYQITLHDPSNNHTGTGLNTATVNVHWTRVVHVADGLHSSEVLGVPRMRPVFNRLYDLRKLYGGSAEMFWRGAFPGVALETHPQLGGDVEIDTTSVRDQMQDYMQGLQRYLAVMGMSVKSLAPQVADPSHHIDAQIDVICSKIGIPKRIFMGSERGELASSQDNETWNNRLADRQNNYLTPRIIQPFVNRLIALGCLPEPQSTIAVQWNDLNMMSEQEASTIALHKTDAMVKYVSGGGEMLMAPMDFLTKIIGMTDEEAESIVESAEEHVQELTDAEDEIEEQGPIEDDPATEPVQE